MCTLEANIKRVKFIDILKQVKKLVEEKEPTSVPDMFWEDQVDKVKQEIA